LYPLECRKKNLSNPNELQAAIEGNKREGRRGSYGSFASSDMLPLSHHPLGVIPGMPSQISPMSLVTGHQRQFNGSSHHGLPPGKSAHRSLNVFTHLRHRNPRFAAGIVDIDALDIIHGNLKTRSLKLKSNGVKVSKV
jgi:hypothetical protein